MSHDDTFWLQTGARFCQGRSCNKMSNLYQQSTKPDASQVAKILNCLGACDQHNEDLDHVIEDYFMLDSQLQAGNEGIVW